MKPPVTLSVLGAPLPTEFAVVRWPPETPLDALLPALRGEFFNLSRAADEWSLVCEAAHAPPGEQRQAGWAALKLHGPFDFALTGILLSVLEPLSTAGIGIFAVSTYDTDYVLVALERLPQALAALRAAGHSVQALP